MLGPGVPRLVAPLVLLFLVATLAVRVALLARDLPYYSVDENEIVEAAVAFTAGDAEPHFFSYGPLVSYMLAMLLLGGDFLVRWTGHSPEWHFFYAALFEPTPFYVVARALHAAAALGCAVFLWAFGRRFLDSSTAVAGLLLGAAPLLERNADFTVRIDTVQGFLSLGALYFCARLGESPLPSRFFLVGVLVGLNIATKPLPGLFLVPAVVLSVLWAAGRTVPADGTSRVRSLVRHVGLFATSLVAAHTVANPYAMLRFRTFWAENLRWVQGGAEVPTTEAGYGIGWLVGVAGWPLALAVAAGLVRLLRANEVSLRPLAAYVVTVCGVYLFIPVRPYWYNAVLPALLLPVARLVGDVANRIERSRRTPSVATAAFVSLALVAWPTWQAILEAREAWSPKGALNRRADRAAELWIEESIPAGSSLLMVGLYSVNLPRVVAHTPRAHGEWAEYFMYGRGLNERWVAASTRAYRRYRQSGQPRYVIERIRRNYSDRYPDPERNRRMNEDIVTLARAGGHGFIVTASPHAFRGRWETEPGVQCRAVFGSATGYRGDEVKVFEVLPRP